MMITAETNGEVFPNLMSIFPNNVVSFVCGFVVCIIVVFIYFCFAKKIIKNIEDGVMEVSFVGAMVCLVISIFFKEIDKSINILSFFCSFVFSWLLTKKSSKEEFIERQQEIAKTSYRHIGDVRKATLVTRDRLSELKKKNEISRSDIDGILDDVEIILQCIKTNEDDWKDMVSETHLNQMKGYIDPEAENVSKNKGVSQSAPDLIVVGKAVREAVGKELGNSIQNKEPKQQ